MNWVTMFLLIGNTANPFFYESIEMLAMSFIVLVGCWFLKGEDDTRFNGYFWTYIMVLTVLQTSQTLTYHVFPLKTFLGEYLRIAFAVLSIRILGRKFFDQFVRFVYVFAVISLFFYFPCVLIKPLAHFLIDHVAKYTQCPFHRADTGAFYEAPYNLIIFNLGQITFNRNSGFYWEPGTHGGFCCLALFINLFYRKKKLMSRFSIIYIITILTTLSTTTYIALFFVIVAYLKNFIARRPLISLFLLLVVVAGGYFAFTRLDFLNKKIDEQIEKRGSRKTGESRFSSLNADLESTRDHPFVGTGRNVEMHFGKEFYNADLRERHRNNGIGVLLATYGVFFFILFLFYNWKSFYLLLGSRTNAWLMLILLIMLAFSEDYFFKAFFIALALYCGITFASGKTPVASRSRKLQLGKNTMAYDQPST
ncbi:MAG TPA: O-antigen ligase family protein [Puia sp.]|nr:O-antigen ligase family protein [Puia sp.]